MIKRLYRSSMASQRQSLYLFGSLEVHRTAYSGSTYTIDDKTLVPYLMSNGVRLARLHYETATTVPQVAGTGLTDALGKTNTAATLHVLLELGDHLGSTGTVLDKVSSELVERTGYLPFGARENDYRPSRWNGFREDYGFTGKEEDVQVGLVYFGKRYLSPQLGRWLSPDPLAVHAPGRADFNLYAYVLGYLLKATDPLGLTCGVDEGCEVNKSTNEGATYNDGTSVTEAKSQVATQQYEASKQPPPSKTSSPEPSPTVRPGSDSASAKPTYTPNFEALAGPLGAVGFALTYMGSSLAGASPQEAREAATRAAVDLAPVDGMLMGVAAARSQRADVNASCQAAPQGVVPERAQPTIAPRAEAVGAKAWSPPSEAASKVPSEWGEGAITRKGVGVRWQDPSDKGNGVRIDKGNPNNSQALQQVDHVLINKGGKVLGPDGKAIPGSIKDHPEAHIPLTAWLKWKTWDSP